MRAEFLRRGFLRFPRDPAVVAWAEAARPLAMEIADAPNHRAAWLRCGGAWFAGVNVFPNDPDGGVAARRIPPLAGDAVGFIRSGLEIEPTPWDAAQISVCYPGYPRHGAEESDAAFAYRRDRDAAHVDGLRRDGPRRRRKPGERHAFILGLPLTEVAADAAPLVVWEGSHEVMRRALSEALDGAPPDRWSDVDVTDAYHAARRRCFETLERVEVPARPGEAYLIHRLALHGVAPWRGAETRPRAIAYFRPELRRGSTDGWLTDP